MKQTIFFLSLAASMFSLASNVQWDCINCVGTSGEWLDFAYTNNENVRAVWVSVMIDYTVAFDATTIRGASSNLMYDGNWLKANAGDKIDSATTMNVGDYFYYCRYGSSGQVESSYNVYDLMLSGDDKIYLAFCAMTFDQSLYAGTDEYIYGWLQLGLDENGVPIVLRSALDLDGGPMIVGGGAYAIPEPSGGMLLLFGAALLALWRRPRALRERADGSPRNQRRIS